MTEQRKYAILFAATLLSARKLIEMEPDKPNMAKGYIVDKAIEDAAFILERIEKRGPLTKVGIIPSRLAPGHPGSRCSV